MFVTEEALCGLLRVARRGQIVMLDFPLPKGSRLPVTPAFNGMFRKGLLRIEETDPLGRFRLTVGESVVPQK
jgi:hypothetical protein